MKKAQIEIGGRYIVRVSGLLTVVRVVGESPYGGWDCISDRTGRKVRVRGAQRFRRRSALQQGYEDARAKISAT